MIHRKVKGDGAVVPAAGDGTLDLSSLVNDLAAIRKHQTAISADLKELQARNHALWQEAVQSREKHKKQEETINKILRFLAGVFGGHVLDQGGAAPSPQVQGEATTPDQAPGVGPGKGAKVVMPKGRLLLEDVKGRQSAALRELDGSDEEIEEIPLLRGDDDELPTISSCASLSSSLSPLPSLLRYLTLHLHWAALVASAPTAGMGTLARAPSHSRFTSIASPASSSALPTPTDGTGVDPAQYGLTPEAFGALVGRTGDSSAFHALFNQQGSSSSSSSAPEPSLTMPASSSSSSSTALLPYVPTTRPTLSRTPLPSSRPVLPPPRPPP